MTEAQFDNGYWYTAELKHFAKELGIPAASKLRKDELETSIKHFLRTGDVKNLSRRKLTRPGIKDVEKGLSLSLPIVNYTSNKETKRFIVEEAKKMTPNLRERSGAWYRLNRWREEQLAEGEEITYEDLVRQYITLNEREGSFSRIPQGRYINFVADYLAGEKNATRSEAIKAWEQLKQLDTPKTYEAWKNSRDSHSNHSQAHLKSSRSNA